MITATGYADLALDTVVKMLASSLVFVNGATLNLVPDSERMDATRTWTASNCTVTPFAALDPAGNVTLCKIERVSGGEGTVSTSIAVPSGPMELQVVGSAGTYATLRAAAGGFIATVDLVSGIAAWVGPAGDSLAVDTLANGCFRLRMRFTLANSTTLPLTLWASVFGGGDRYLYVGQVSLAPVGAAYSLNPVAAPEDLIVESIGGVQAAGNAYRAVSGNVITVGTYQCFAIVSQRSFREPQMVALGDWAYAGQVAIDVYRRRVSTEAPDSGTRRLRGFMQRISADLKVLRGTDLSVVPPGYQRMALHHFTCEEETLAVQDDTGALAEWLEGTLLVTWQSP